MTAAVRPLQLGYVGLSVSDPDAFATFAERVLGMVSVPVQGAARALRMDERSHRIRVHQGERNDLAYLGWQAADDATLDALVASLGVTTTELAADWAHSRGARRVVAFVDPAGVPGELFVVDETLHPDPFVSPKIKGGFVTGGQGLGHAAIRSDVRGTSERFYGDLLGLKLSDRITCRAGDIDVDIAFMRTNARHHSVALAGPITPRMHHMMLQVATLDDLGRAYDRAVRAQVNATTLGRHPNDRMVSFYVRTPPGFQIEIGWGGLEVDDTTWSPTTYDRVALWGHMPVDPP
jgi:biphenyl-2,3-diol 1,2-dioxygenase/3,4-dihydroxy-9,10-secoandrosta-1,3,5(10)-triene-9,17-dione 4,5-dioxygenase